MGGQAVDRVLVKCPSGRKAEWSGVRPQRWVVKEPTQVVQRPEFKSLLR